MTSVPARIALTSGEPAGIGPDVCLKLAERAHRFDLVVLADPELLAARARQLRIEVGFERYRPETRHAQEARQLTVLPVKLRAPVTAGRPDPANAPYVLEMLRRAADGCLAGEFSALVTAPLHKGVLAGAGVAFSGHTEFLARHCRAPLAVMLLAAGDLRVALATTHLPLKDVPATLTPERLEQTLRVLHSELQRKFAIPAPRILVLGLNPHAGEGGHLGREEIEVIAPVCARLRAEGYALTGPVAADTAFRPQRLAESDVVLAMYHDQGLPVLKYAGFGRAVNVTLGLPIIRTSVDHGTALELAGTGRADASSLEAALAMALSLAESERRIA